MRHNADWRRGFHGSPRSALNRICRFALEHRPRLSAHWNFVGMSFQILDFEFVRGHGAPFELRSDIPRTESIICFNFTADGSGNCESCCASSREIVGKDRQYRSVSKEISEVFKLALPGFI